MGPCVAMAWRKTMVREDGKRNFALREANGDETSVFSGNTPRQAALKAARRLDGTGVSEDEADREDIRLREKGTDKVHIYEGWAWEEDAPTTSRTGCLATSRRRTYPSRASSTSRRVICAFAGPGRHILSAFATRKH